MTRAHDAADAVRRAAQMYEQFVVAAEILEQIGSLEQATNEAAVAKLKAIAERDAALMDLADAQVAVQQARADAEEQYRAATEREGKIIAKATAAAETMLGEAQAQVDALIAKAQAEAERMMVSAREQNARLAENAARLAAEIKERELDLIAAQAATEDAEGRLAAAQEKIKQMLGG